MEQNPNDNYFVQTGQEPQNDGLNPDPNFGQVIGSALAYFFAMLAFILFVCPFSFWKGAAYRLYKACKNKSLNKFVHTSRWPFFSFIKKVFFEFIIDGTIFITYFIGALVSIIMLFTDGGFLAFILGLIITWYSPMGLSWVRDLCVLALLPFEKFLSWVSKPAQQIDVDFHNR